MDALYAEIEPREDAIRTEYRGKIREVLTPEQQAEWDKIKGEYRQKWNGKEVFEEEVVTPILAARTRRAFGSA